MRVSIQIKKRKGSFEMQLATEDASGSGQRQLQAPSCKELLSTAAVIVSLAMQPDLLFQNESEHKVVTSAFVQGQAGDDETPGKALSLDERASLLWKDDYDSGSGLNIAVGLAALADIGTLPRTAIGIGLVASARSKRYRLSFRLTQWAEQRTYLESFKKDRGGNFDYLSASIHLCRDFTRGRIAAGLCGIIGLGRLNGESIVIDLPISQTHIMASAGPGSFLRFATGKNSALRIQGELVAQFLRPNYNAMVIDADNDEVVINMHIHKVSALSARLAASWGLTF